MSYCTKTLQKLNDAEARGENHIVISDEDLKMSELEELRECGFIIDSVEKDGITTFYISK